MKRDFNEWLRHFKSSICNYEYYVNFDKVYKNVADIKLELNIMNTLIGSDDIENEFRKLIKDYPEVLKCIPTLLAVRQKEIFAMDEDGEHIYDFVHYKDSIDTYVQFMKKTGLFDLIAQHLIHNLVDYVTGVEVGLDSNGRKNRGGQLMEDIVESFIKKTNVEYYKEMYLDEIETLWGLDLSPLSNQGKTRKRFDFVVKTNSTIFAIETNFYQGSGGGSKLNETARSYKLLAQESKDINGFKFVWLTDGTAWKNAQRNLRETFEETKYIYSIVDLENGALEDLFNEQKSS